MPRDGIEEFRIPPIHVPTKVYVHEQGWAGGVLVAKEAVGIFQAIDADVLVCSSLVGGHLDVELSAIMLIVES